MEMLKLIAATAYTSPGTSTVVPAIAFATADRSVGPYRIDVRADQIVLPGSAIAVSDSALVRKPELVE